MSQIRLLVAVALAVVVTAASAQTTTTASSESRSGQTIDGGEPVYLWPETPEKRQARLGTAEDPGPDPNPETIFWRFGKAQKIDKYLKRWVVSDCGDATWIRPMAMANICRELYQQNEKFVWVWADDRSQAPAQAEAEPAPAAPPSTPEESQKQKYPPQVIDYLNDMRAEFSVLEPPASGVTFRFEESSEGLPRSGSWRNSLAIADMNGDGKLDIVAPPERGRPTSPVIFLGDGAGKWTGWTAPQWPVNLDYGDVEAADFNRDGHADLAFAVHLKGIFVLLGDGKGGFTNSEQGLPRDFPSRRLQLADVDRDGYTDIVAIHEGATTLPNENPDYGKVRVFLNRKKGTVWEGINVSGPERLTGGDWLTVANLNGDKYPDVISASVFMNGTDVVWLSDGSKKWKSAATPDNKAIPSLGYYYANGAGHFTSKKQQDAIVAFTRFWLTNADPKETGTPDLAKVTGIEMLSIGPKGKVKRTPIMRGEGTTAIWGLTTADFDNDRRDDIAFARFVPRDIVILTGDGKGGFKRAAVQGIEIPSNSNYDLRAADVNGDSLPDLVMAFETGQTSHIFAPRDGSIRVFLNRGPVVQTAN